MSFMLAIVGTRDNPLYTLEFGTSKSGGDGTPKFREDQRPMNQFILHSSLDIVEEVQWTSGIMYMKSIDKFNSNLISTFLTAGNIKLMLLHELRNDDGIKNFFNDVYELYTKTLMSPFYAVNMPIKSQVFDQRVRALAKKYL
ncbi:Trafficking protein particle complex subunit 2 [Taphrina deformans PYCC 5710]|uniref:Trafficking protein particle complex subunit 2 n=1 Tax=Taphrina deformans (strain PYCC 5710 / ATCC 11124 / CBS 356.35 / IMI 108563 / JCM 9778 / NBRC 8474) TaxID=1097556 RepID=R4XHH3_TAPDE|nr:Trafficking protein particle complex subunit 2 [Taphrina deformans PYCC 5710]|eukprot:CCG82867.1 Trafficking protein particle complex subunit 2 [Taphrina deformans PYCC 5710]